MWRTLHAFGHVHAFIELWSPGLQFSHYSFHKGNSNINPKVDFHRAVICSTIRSNGYGILPMTLASTYSWPFHLTKTNQKVTHVMKASCKASLLLPQCSASLLNQLPPQTNHENSCQSVLEHSVEFKWHVEHTDMRQQHQVPFVFHKTILSEQ